MCKLITKRLYEEYTILWFEFDLCGLRHRRDAMDPTLDNDTGGEGAFQRQEQVRNNSTGQLHAMYHIVSNTHWRWYLLYKKQNRVKTHNLLKEFSQKQIYVKYTLPVGQASNKNKMNYLFKSLFNTFRKSRVKICIIMFLVCMSLLQRMI